MGIVRGGDDERALRHHGLEKRASERGAFLRVGRAVELVHEDEAPIAHVAQDLLEAQHVAREARKVLLDRLRVAEVGEERVEERDDRLVDGGEGEARARAKAREP